MKRLATPDTTRNQVIAIATMIVGLAASMGMPLSEANENRVFLAATALSVALTVADAVIRFGRAMMAGKKFDDVDLGLDDYPEE